MILFIIWLIGFLAAACVLDGMDAREGIAQFALEKHYVRTPEEAEHCGNANFVMMAIFWPLVLFAFVFIFIGCWIKARGR